MSRIKTEHKLWGIGYIDDDSDIGNTALLLYRGHDETDRDTSGPPLFGSQAAAQLYIDKVLNANDHYHPVRVTAFVQWNTRILGKHGVDVKPLKRKVTLAKKTGKLYKDPHG